MASSGAFIRADWGDMKRALNDEKYRLAFAAGMYAAALVVERSLKVAAPKFPGPEPLSGKWSKNSAPGTFKDSIHILPMGIGMVWIISSIPSAHMILSGHKVLSTPGQRKWFHANYPGNYVRRSPGEWGSDVPPNNFALKIGEFDVVALQAIVAKRIQMVVGV
jgi:hypothetical protein